MNKQIYDDVKKIKGKNRLNPIGKAKHYTLSFLSDDEFYRKMGIIEPITYIPLIMRLSTSLDIFREADNEYINEARELLKRNNID